MRARFPRSLERMFCVSLLFLCGPVLAASLPTRLIECEKVAGCTGEWRFSGKEGTAHWPNGVTAKLVIERFEEDQVIIRRTDVSRQTLGATAVYTGKIRGNQLQGDATYLWPGHWNNQPVVVSWSATIEGAPAATPASIGASGTSSNGLIGSWHNPNGEPFHFDGRNSIAIDTPGLDLPDGSSWTLEAWVYPTSLVPGGTHVAGKRADCRGGGGFYQLGIGHNAPGTGMGAEMDTVRINDWNHLVIAMNGDLGWTVYTNGIVTKTVSSPGWHIRNRGPFRIGNSGNCRAFSGDIQEVSLYNRELSEGEVKALFLAGRTGQPTLTASVPRPQTALHTPPQTPPQTSPPPIVAASHATSANSTPLRPSGGSGAEPSPDDAWVPQKRLALVIGNSRYAPTGGAAGSSVWPDLQEGPVKDADAVAARLRAIGFDVTEFKNLNIDQMMAALRAFSDRIAAAPDSLALFYFSGHGARAPRDLGDDGEETYIIPVDTNLQYDVDAHSKAVGLLEVRNVMRRSRAGVVILDACRNNALHRPPTRAAGTRGLAAPNNVTGMLFAYSTSAGDVADNRPGEMSEYTELLVRELGLPGQSLTGSFRKVRKQIAQLHQSRLPELTDELNDDVVLVPR